MPKYNLPDIEFYITNVCNLTCSECRTLNNYQFKGHYNFDYDTYKPWSDVLNISRFDILGGEPTLNPNLLDWMVGLRTLWPNANGFITTNGTHLGKVKNLHKIAAKYNYNIKIGMHAVDLRKLIATQILSAFGDCKILPIQQKKFKGQDCVNEIVLETDLGVRIHCQSYEHFQVSPFKNAKFEFYDSDPKIAHNNCNIRNCHHMINGNLYKCGFVSTAAEFLKQQHVPVPPLLSAYVPLTVDKITSQSVLNNLQNYIPQCGLCQEKNQVVKFTSTLKNKKTFKIHNLIDTKQISV